MRTSPSTATEKNAQLFATANGVPNINAGEMQEIKRRARWPGSHVSSGNRRVSSNNHLVGFAFCVLNALYVGTSLPKKLFSVLVTVANGVSRIPLGRCCVKAIRLITQHRDCVHSANVPPRVTTAAVRGTETADPLTHFPRERYLYRGN